MNLSILGLVLALAYVGMPVYYAWRVVSKDSYGGLFTEEMALFVVTLPCSPLGELLFKRHKYARLVVYALSTLINAAILYLVGWGIQSLVAATTRTPG